MPSTVFQVDKNGFPIRPEVIRIHCFGSFHVSLGGETCESCPHKETCLAFNNQARDAISRQDLPAQRNPVSEKMRALFRENSERVKKSIEDDREKSNKRRSDARKASKEYQDELKEKRDEYQRSIGRPVRPYIKRGPLKTTGADRKWATTQRKKGISEEEITEGLRRRVDDRRVKEKEKDSEINEIEQLKKNPLYGMF